MNKKSIETTNYIINEFDKRASFGSVVSKGLGHFGSGVSTLGKAIVSGFKPVPKTAPFGEKAFGFAIKGLGLTGAYAGGSKIVKSVTGPRSKSDYTTLLRNNILAGNIKPEEVPISDARFVNELGMR